MEELSTETLEGVIGLSGGAHMKDEKLLKCETIEFLICKKKRVSMAVFQDSDTIYKDMCKSLVF